MADIVDDLIALLERVKRLESELESKYPGITGKKRSETMATKEAAATEEKKKKVKDVQIVRQGEQIILPEGMEIDDGIKWLTVKREEDQRVVRVDEEIDAFPLDGAYALSRALYKKYGFTSLAATPGFFGDNPPAMIGMEVGVGQTVQVPWGRIVLHDISGWLHTAYGKKGARPIFRIVAEVKQKDRHKVAEIAQLTRELVKQESVYRGKAIKMRFSEPDEDFDVSKAPTFLDVSRVDARELVFSADVMAQVETSLFTPLERTDLCRKYQIPLKRGVLLEGPYGTGKTLTAYVAAKKAEENGWTFVYLETVAQLEQAILFAQNYQPAMIFAEDIDQVLGDDDRDEETNGILNTIDGVVSKDSAVMVVLTTNHVEKINPAMLRPGRLDAVISVRPPDGPAVQKLIRLYARDLIAPSEDLSRVGELLDTQQPALIREVIERAKLAAVARLREGESLNLRSADLELASKSMLRHLELLRPAAVDDRSDLEKAAGVLAGAISPAPKPNGAKQLAKGNGNVQIGGDAK